MASQPDQPVPPLLGTELQRVKIAVLGAQGVGKTSIVRQFVLNHFQEEYVPTTNRSCYHPSIIINDHLYEVNILDCPMIPYFPVSSLYEWADFRGYGLRTATAYILVFDITNDESFQYVKTLHEQIVESRGQSHDVPIFVVGNKRDLGNDRNISKREVANVVKKQWKTGYMECSAKYNWHVVVLFKEVMKTLDYLDWGGHKPASLRVQDAFRRNRCTIL
ncbi:hypothetical protein CAPTEDRAFT_93308 [Capitella teleta]|uniref:Ras-like protein family member 10B n=1 Tax=Capitella teleta TaxID=283909 RepID=R7T3K1_CAPTE|nr:hypothetical protein CAPTEDRAFT_93308 [Capitella teleta]|eukprot:ELT87273.1 hypothetical protein CAPTEDRAFT_93308 [Capitella teleta]